MFATNLLGPFLLTNLVLPQLQAAGSARVLVISAPSGTKLDFDDLQGERRFRSLTNFGASKAADLLFTFELARRLDGTGVTANAIHPGLVRTSLMNGAPAVIRWAVWPFSGSPESAATTIVPLALDPAFEDRSGQFFHHAKAIDPPKSTRDPDVRDDSGRRRRPHRARAGPWLTPRPRAVTGHTDPPKSTRDADVARRLWDVAADLTGFEESGG